MIVTHDDSSAAVLSNVASTGEFKIKNSARAFSILSSGLYSNKIKAIIRELSCNAVDSHCAANKADVPFEVHLPCLLEPWFSIRDFGLGLTAADVSHIYTTYFESTKTNSNDYIGALGLGSKSPFSYTENFSVTAISGGKKNIFSAFINEHGVPSIALLDESCTDEENGVEVKFSVHVEQDYRKFRDEAAEVFRWFSLQPTVIGKFYPLTNSYARKDIIPGVHFLGSNRASVAVMGNIAYPLHNFPNKEQVLGTLAALLSNGLELHFDIGALDFSASREELSYDTPTIAAIRGKLEQLAEFLSHEVEETANAIDNEWKRAAYLEKTRRQCVFTSAVDLYIKNTGFTLCRSATLYSFDWTNTELYTAYEVRVRRFAAGNFSVKKRDFRRSYSNGPCSVCVEIPIDDTAIFVLNDLKIGAIARIRHHYSAKNYYGNIYLIDTDVDLANRQSTYDTFMSALHIPPTIIKASELSREIKEKQIPASILRCNYSKGQVRWDDIDDMPDDSETCYYIPLTGTTPLIKKSDGSYTPFDDYSFTDLLGNLRTSFISSLKDLRVYGVRKRRLAEIESKSNWIPLLDMASQCVNALTATELNQIIVRRFLDSTAVSVYTDKDVVKHINRNSIYVELINQLGQLSVTCNSAEHYSTDWLCQKFFIGPELNNQLINIKTLCGDVEARYPLLTHLREYSKLPCQTVADYINLIDNSLTP